MKSLSQRAIKEISLELREVSISKSNQRDQSRTAWSLYLDEQTLSESASMTCILNAIIYSLSLLYSSVNLIIRSHATSESATITSSKLIFSMSKSISESASMTLSMQWFIYSHRSTHQWIDSSIHSCATSESATMTR